MGDVSDGGQRYKNPAFRGVSSSNVRCGMEAIVNSAVSPVCKLLRAQIFNVLTTHTHTHTHTHPYVRSTGLTKLLLATVLHNVHVCTP